MHANAAEMFDHMAWSELTGYNPWYMDSGASGHVVGDFNRLDQFHGETSSQNVRTAEGKTHEIQGVGTATVKTNSGELKLTEIKYVPSLKRNLISVGAITDTGNLVVFSKTHCWILDKVDHNRIIATGYRNPINGLYSFGNTLQTNMVASENTSTLWHRRYGHLSYKGLSHLSTEQRVIGLPAIELTTKTCESCLAGRQARKSFPQKLVNRASEPAERIHSDLMGPMQVPSLGGSRYTLVFTDDYSRKSWTYFLKAKDETFLKFKQFKQLIETETRNKICILRTDRGGEFLSNEFRNFCEDHGISRELTQALTPQQNGVAEWRNRSIMEKARSLSDDCKLPTFLWSEAVNTANYLLNLSPTSANSGMTPEQLYSRTIPFVQHLKIFGCLAYLHIPDEKRKKLDSKTMKCLFLGYDSESKTYKLYDNIKRKIILSRDVTCDELKIGYHYLSQPLVIPDEPSIFGQNNEDNTEQTNPDEILQPLETPGSPSTSHTNSDYPVETSSPSENQETNPVKPPIQSRPKRTVTVETETSEKRYPTRTRAPSSRLKDFWTMVSELMEEPLTYDEAIKDEGWSEAMNKEIESIIKNQTWEVVDRPADKVPITGMWIYKIKREADGKVKKLKARIVARGFQQTQGIDYTDIFVPVVRWLTIKLVLVLAAKFRWKLRQMDVITAFFNGVLNEEVYMEIPAGFSGAGDPTKVCKINRALYGLRQSPKAWYKHIDTWLTSQGLSRSNFDPNLYFADDHGKLTIVLLYVDDMLITGDNENEIRRIQTQL
jgi:transposase InsO family protein